MHTEDPGKRAKATWCNPQLTKKATWAGWGRTLCTAGWPLKCGSRRGSLPASPASPRLCRGSPSWGQAYPQHRPPGRIITNSPQLTHVLPLLSLNRGCFCQHHFQTLSPNLKLTLDAHFNLAAKYFRNNLFSLFCAQSSLQGTAYPGNDAGLTQAISPLFYTFKAANL